MQMLELVSIKGFSNGTLKMNLEMFTAKIRKPNNFMSNLFLPKWERVLYIFYNIVEESLETEQNKQLYRVLHVFILFSSKFHKW